MVLTICRCYAAYASLKEKGMCSIIVSLLEVKAESIYKTSTCHGYSSVKSWAYCDSSRTSAKGFFRNVCVMKRGI